MDGRLRSILQFTRHGEGGKEEKERKGKERKAGSKAKGTGEERGDDGWNELARAVRAAQRGEHGAPLQACGRSSALATAAEHSGCLTVEMRSASESGVCKQIVRSIGRCCLPRGCLAVVRRERAEEHKKELVRRWMKK